MASLWALIRREPVRAANLLKAIVVCALALGLHITPGQRDALLGLAAAIIAMAEVVRSQVSPNVHTEERRSTTDGP
jgi:hypothetical protein